jgi:hypothetical protein
VEIAATSTTQGSWLVDSLGDVYPFGAAVYHGGTGALHLAKAMVGIAADPATGGYWLAASDGEVFRYGNHPSTGRCQACSNQVSSNQVSA